MRAAEAAQGGGLQNNGKAEARVRLRCLVACRGGLFEAARRKVGDAERRELQISRRIVRAQPESAFAVLYRLLDTTVVGKDRRAEAERQRRGAVQGQRVVNGVHRGFIVVLDEADHEARGGERRRVVRAGRQRRARMLERGDLVGLVHAAAHVALLVAPGRKGMGGGIVRFKGERLVKP